MVGKWLESTGTKLPETLPENRVRMTVILRLTPGIPFFSTELRAGISRSSFPDLSNGFPPVREPSCVWFRAGRGGDFLRETRGGDHGYVGDRRGGGGAGLGAEQVGGEKSGR